MNDRLDLHAWVDGQLDPANQEAVRNAMATDPALKAEADAIANVKSVLKKHCGEGVPNPQLFSACKARLDELDRVRKADFFVGKYAWGLCGAFVLLIAGAAFMNRNNSASTLYTSDMARLTQSLSPVQLPSFRQNQDEKVVQAIGPTQLSIGAEGVEILAMATGLVDGRRAARLTLADPNGVVALLVVENVNKVEVQEQRQSNQVFCHGKIEGTNCVTWTAGGFGMILAGERDCQELERLAAEIRIQR